MERVSTGSFAAAIALSVGGDHRAIVAARAVQPFHRNAAAALRRRLRRVRTYPCDAQVGAAGFRIDLGVRHREQAGRYILAVECDGATYHSALWARERDRLRQDVLEGLGWRFHRVWSTDWFHRRGSEIGRLRAALEAAALEEGPAFAGANTGGRPRPEEVPEPGTSDREAVPLPAPPDLTAPAYIASSFSASMPLEPHEAPMPYLVDLVTRVVEAEGPIHRDLVARRVAEAFGKVRTGSRIRDASDQAIDRAVRAGSVLLEGGFAMTLAQREDPLVRNRSGEGAPTKADLLPPVEIRAAAARVVAESGEMPREEIIMATARLLGFAKTGKDLREKISSALFN